MSLEYNDKQIEDRIRISPSSLYDYYDNPARWFKRNVLKERDATNENLIIGNIIHSRIEQYYKGEAIDYDAELEYLDKFKDDPDIDEWNVTNTVLETWKYLENEYLPTTIKPDSMEQWIEYIPRSNEDVFIGGTYDYIRYEDNLCLAKVLGDYKTCNSLPTGIKTHHRLQLYAYAFMLNMQGEAIDKIEVTYIQKWDKGKENEKWLNASALDKSKYKQYVGSKKADVKVFIEAIDEELYSQVVEDFKNLGTILSMCKKDKKLVPLFFRNNYLSHF